MTQTIADPGRYLNAAENIHHPFEPTSWEQIVAMLPYTDVQFAPGSKYSYSNPGVIFLGRIIQLLSGDDYEVYIAKNMNTDTTPSKDGTRLGSRQVDAAVRELMLKNVINK